MESITDTKTNIVTYQDPSHLLPKKIVILPGDRPGKYEAHDNLFQLTMAKEAISERKMVMKKYRTLFPTINNLNKTEKMDIKWRYSLKKGHKVMYKLKI